jgi:NAD(P)-dependent dehydrogenase (short-subunit alcohol dehydrogenase family)
VVGAEEEMGWLIAEVTWEDGEEVDREEELEGVYWYGEVDSKERGIARDCVEVFMEKGGWSVVVVDVRRDGAEVDEASVGGVEVVAGVGVVSGVRADEEEEEECVEVNERCEERVEEGEGKCVEAWEAVVVVGVDEARVGATAEA